MFNPLNAELNPISKSQLAELFCRVFKFCAWYSKYLNIPRTKRDKFVKQKVFFGANGRQHHGCILPQAVTHSLMLLKMGRIIARNMLSWLESLLSRYCRIYLVVYIIYISLYFLRLAKQSQFIPLQNVVYFIMLPCLVHKIFTFYINDLLLFKCPFPGPKA